MSEIVSQFFEPREGKVVELPEEVGRIDSSHDRGGPLARPRLKIGVVGQGPTEPHVVLSVGGEGTNVTDGSQILTADPLTDRTWFAIPQSKYGGGD